MTKRKRGIMKQEFIFVLIVISVIITIYYKHKNKLKLLNSPEVQHNISRANEFLKCLEETKNDYFRHSVKEVLQEEYKELYNRVKKGDYKKISSYFPTDFVIFYQNLEILVKNWNEEFVNNELTKHSELFDDIDGKSLDDQQRYAVVVAEDNNLVLAGAGSGKTLTVSAKVKYLVDRKGIDPEDILLITFTRKAAEEMQLRIKDRLKINIEAMTFHKLGLDIISRDTGKRPDVFEGLPQVIDKYFKEVVDKDVDIISNIVTYFGMYINVPKDLEGFDNLGEVHDHYRSVDFETIKSKVQMKLCSNKETKTTIQGEKVRSLEEVMIANYLYLNGVRYTYERLFPIDTADQYRRQYKPDFYLEDYDIYLEHFGINCNNKVPWLSEIEEIKYLNGIEWKRDLHKRSKTTLIETYSYYVSEGRLFKELDKLLKAHDIVYKKIDYAEVYNAILDDLKSNQLSEFKKLIQSFIGLFKSRGFSVVDFDILSEKVSSGDNSFFAERNKIFLSIVKPIFIAYQNELMRLREIDFNDMINMATDIVRQRENLFKYKYIIIDEYQDISISRFNLVKEIKNKTNARVMAVGDDWQSIYRFAGSDVDLFTNFSSYLGYSEVMKIEKTYRNSQELIDISGKFIMKNSKQLTKQLKSDKNHKNPLKILVFRKDFESAFISAIKEIVKLHGNSAEIMILGRNNFDIDILNDSKRFKVSKKSKDVSIVLDDYPDMKMQYLTTHRSKGLEAENVILINLENKLVGFPNQISDDPVLSMVMTDSDNFLFAEERRLFYVAITRTKNCTYLITPDYRESIFVNELVKEFNINNDLITNEDSYRNNPKCPVCQKGNLVLRENQTSKTFFLGCTNYPYCETSFKNVEILEENIRCFKCGGYMVKRKSSYGEFYGCTNYPFCKQTIKVENLWI